MTLRNAMQALAILGSMIILMVVLVFVGEGITNERIAQSCGDDGTFYVLRGGSPVIYSCRRV